MLTVLSCQKQVHLLALAQRLGHASTLAQVVLNGEGDHRLQPGQPVKE
jgi:hypothetical protein